MGPLVPLPLVRQREAGGLARKAWWGSCQVPSQVSSVVSQLISNVDVVHAFSQLSVQMSSDPECLGPLFRSLCAAMFPDLVLVFSPFNVCTTRRYVCMYVCMYVCRCCTEQ